MSAKERTDNVITLRCEDRGEDRLRDVRTVKMLRLTAMFLSLHLLFTLLIIEYVL